MLQPQFNPPAPTAVVLDNFFTDPDAVRQFALTLEYREDVRYYRGRRSTTRHLWPGLKERFERALGRQITGWDEQGTNGVFQYCVGGDQIVYHSDQQTHAAVVYLTPDAPPSSGTTLVRSRLTKGRTVDETLRLHKIDPQYRPRVEQEMYGGKLLDGTAWEPVDVLGNVYNRLVLWDARMAHHASAYFGHDLRSGRLFQMFFFSCE